MKKQTEEAVERLAKMPLGDLYYLADELDHEGRVMQQAHLEPGRNMTEEEKARTIRRGQIVAMIGDLVWAVAKDKEEEIHDKINASYRTA